MWVAKEHSPGEDGQCHWAPAAHGPASWKITLANSLVNFFREQRLVHMYSRKSTLHVEILSGLTPEVGARQGRSTWMNEVIEIDNLLVTS